MCRASSMHRHGGCDAKQEVLGESAKIRATVVLWVLRTPNGSFVLYSTREVSVSPDKASYSSSFTVWSEHTKYADQSTACKHRSSRPIATAMQA